MEDHIFNLVRQGRKYEAIKLIRETVGLSVVQSIKRINEIEATSSIMSGHDSPIMPPLPTKLHRQVINFLPNQKIYAIKEVREEMMCSLAEAKDYVEDIQYGRRPPPEDPPPFRSIDAPWDS